MKLLEHDPDTNVLKMFPLSVYRPVVTAIVGYFANPANNPCEVLTSRAHVLWAFECIGQGLRLPVEDAQIMSDCLAIYLRWADEKTRPACLSDDPDFYISVTNSLQTHIHFHALPHTRTLTSTLCLTHAHLLPHSASHNL